MSHVNLTSPNRRADSMGVASHAPMAARPLDLSGSDVRDGRTPIELECVQIQQERVALWRSGAARAHVVELPRRSTENGWRYDRAA
jgi:hypothetical protein